MTPERIRIDKISKQFKCLRYPLVRITASFPKGVEGMPINCCKDRKSGVETFWNLDDVLARLPLLSKYNLEGRNIFVTPIEADEITYMLIDDLRPAFFKAGFRPNLLIQTSPHKQQAVFVLPYKYPRRIYIDAFNRLNVDLYGDEDITGLRHPFRLLGFANPKPEHRQPDGEFPFVDLVSRSQKICPAMEAWIDNFAAPLLAGTQARPAPSQETPQASSSHSGEPSKPKAIPAPRPPIMIDADATGTEQAYLRHAEDIRSFDPEANDARVDFRVAQRLIVTGHAPEAIADAVSKLSGRQRTDNDKYASDTVRNAQARAGELAGKLEILRRIEAGEPIRFQPKPVQASPARQEPRPLDSRGRPRLGVRPRSMPTASPDPDLSPSLDLCSGPADDTALAAIVEQDDEPHDPSL